jgi:hypothetical protein
VKGASRLALFTLLIVAACFVASCGGRSQAVPQGSIQSNAGARKPESLPPYFSDPGVNECGAGNVQHNVDVVCDLFEGGTATYAYQFPNQECNNYCGGPVSWQQPPAMSGYVATVTGPTQYTTPFVPLVTITVSYLGTPPPDPVAYQFTAEGIYKECADPELTQNCTPYTTYGANGRVYALVENAPSLSIVDISPDNPNPTKAAGQQVVLKAVPSPASLPLTNVVWTVPTPVPVIASYTHAPVTTYGKFSATSPTTNPIAFYWTSGVSAQVVKVTAKIYTATVTATSAPLTAQLPTVSNISAKYGAIYSGSYLGTQWLFSLTQTSSQSHGIQYSAEITAPPAAGGYFASTQLLNAVEQYYPTPSPASPVTFPDSAGLGYDNPSPAPGYNDTCPLYGAPISVSAGGSGMYAAHDDPSLIFTANRAYKITIVNNFETYLIFRPTGTKSIWITLDQIAWGWYVTGLPNGAGGWADTSPPVGANSGLLPTSPVVSASSQILTWPLEYTSASETCPTEPPS